MKQVFCKGKDYVEKYKAFFLIASQHKLGLLKKSHYLLAHPRITLNYFSVSCQTECYSKVFNCKYLRDNLFEPKAKLAHCMYCSKKYLYKLT